MPISQHCEGLGRWPTPLSPRMRTARNSVRAALFPAFGKGARLLIRSWADRIAPSAPFERGKLVLVRDWSWEKLLDRAKSAKPSHFGDRKGLKLLLQ